jgi:hypothetical protein
MPTPSHVLSRNAQLARSTEFYRFSVLVKLHQSAFFLAASCFERKYGTRGARRAQAHFGSQQSTVRAKTWRLSS